MARSVVLGNGPRCEGCRFSPRWCICSGSRAIDCGLQVNVLIHYREYWRPTSTGRLIERVISNSRSKIFRADVSLTPDDFIEPDRPLWVLHPNGEPLTETSAPPGLQLLLLDGSWREAGRMMQTVQSWGRRVSLPMSGPSRYWLRGQQREGNFSTVEALMAIFQTLGLNHAHQQLRLQFELHVYAGLRTRGDKASAEAFLAESPIRDAFPELLAQLAEKRPRI